MASITRSRVNELTDKEIAAVQLSNRKQYGAYVTYEALSSNGVDKYIVTLRDGRATWCECKSNVPCKHRAAAEFEEAWSAPSREEELAGAAIIGESVLGDDMTAHIDDSMGEMEAIMAEIIADELVRKEVAAIPSIDSDPMDELDRVQAEKARKMAANQAYRDAFPGDYGYCDAA